MSKNKENNKSNPIFKENYLNKNFSNLRQKELWSKYIDKHLKIGTEPWSFERWSNNNFVKNALESSAPITDSMANEIFIGTTGIVGKYLGSSMGKWYANNKEGNIFQHIELYTFSDELGKGIIWEGFKVGVVSLSPKNPYVIGIEAATFITIDFCAKLRDEINFLEENNMLNSYNLGLAYKKASLDGVSGIPVGGKFIKSLFAKLTTTFGKEFTIGFFSESKSYIVSPSKNSRFVRYTKNHVLPFTNNIAKIQDGVLYIYNIKNNFISIFDNGHEDPPKIMITKSGLEVTDEFELKYLNEKYDEEQEMIAKNKKLMEERHEYYSKLSKEEIFELARKMDEEQDKYYCLENFLSNFKEGKIDLNFFMKIRDDSCRIFTDKQLIDLIHYFEYMSIEEIEDFNKMTDEEKIKFMEDFLNTDNLSSQENIPDKFIVNKIPDEEIISKYDNKFDLEHLNLYVGIANEILTELIYLKNWKEMNKNQRIEYILGSILISSTKLPEIQCDNDAVKILNFLGNCIRKGNVDVKDVVMLGVKLADIEFPLDDIVNIVDGIINNNNKEIEESMIFLMIDLIALSNPFFGFIKSVIVCIKLLDNILTKHSVINIGGVEALETVKIRYNWYKNVKLKDFLFKPIKFLASLFKREVKIDNDFFGIHGRGKGRHTRDAKEKAIKDFINQAMYKVFQVLGIPYEFMNLGDPKNRFESYSRMIRIKDSLDKWFEINGKYLSEKEKNAIKRNRTLSEDDKDYLVLLFNRGLKPSWYFNHKNENPITFFSNLIGQLNNVKNLEDFLHDLYNLFVPQKDKNSDLYLNKTIIKPILNNSKELGIWSQLKFSQSDLDLWKKLGLISDDLKKNLENSLNLNNESVFKRWDNEAIKIYEKARDSRSSKDNKELKDWNEREKYLYENHLGKYSNIMVLSRINLNILKDEISVGYIFNMIHGCSVGSISAFLAYLDKNLEILIKKPKYWLKYNFRNFIRNCATSYITTILCSHIMTIPSIINRNGIDLFSDNILNNISFGLNSFVNAGISIYQKFNKKIKFNEIINIGLESLFESTISNVSRIIITKTLTGVIIKGISAKIAVALSSLISISLSPMVIASILTGATIFIVKRGVLWAIDCVKSLFNKKSESKVNIIKYETENNLELSKPEIIIFNNKYLNGSILRNNKYLNKNILKNNKHLNGNILKDNKYLDRNILKDNKYLDRNILKDNKYLDRNILKNNKYLNRNILKKNKYLNRNILKNNKYLKGHK